MSSGKVSICQKPSKTVAQDQLKKLFEHPGEITKLVLPPTKAGMKISPVLFTRRSGPWL